MKGLKTGGRQKGTPNKITTEIKDKISVLLSGTMDSIDISTFTQTEKIKLIQVLCNYIVPKLQSADYQIGTPDVPSSVHIKFVDSSGQDISEMKSEEIKTLSMLDTDDLGLAQDLNSIIDG
tara:strand:+ start:71 stop:433 length:363 start_codon:yes stop_codon:yes gene_type:complete